ncbi:MAG: elongator complex protein 3 [Myxococcota bacterium]
MAEGKGGRRKRQNRRLHKRLSSSSPEQQKMNPEYNLIIPLFLPFEGCEHRCIYCNQRLLHPENDAISNKIIDETIHRYLTSYKKPREITNIEVAFYGGSFTAISIERQLKLLEVLKTYIQNRVIDGIRFSTRPDKLNKDLLIRYKTYGVTTIEIGAQSFNDNILKAIKRNHTAQDIKDAITLLKREDFICSLHLMFGLPFSTIEDDITSIEETIKLSPNFVRIHPTLVLRGTELEQLYLGSKYRPLTLNEATEIIGIALRRFYESNIKVIRVGLHNDENLISPETIVAGPFHPSIRQLAEKRLNLK